MNSSPLDVVNGCFEMAGALSAWMNVRRLRRDREVKGIVWQWTIVCQFWGIWNIWYYYGLHQWFSWTAGIALCAGNTVWVITMGNIIRDHKKM
jgi:hypothetical protein